VFRKRAGRSATSPASESKLVRSEREMPTTRSSSNQGDPSSELAATLAMAVLFIAVCFISYVRGLNYSVQPWGTPYFYLNYSEGIVKRGLIGSLFSPFAQGDSLDAAIVFSHWALSVLLVLTLWAGCRRTFPGTRNGLAIALLLLFACSQFLPTLAYNTGYLDVYVFVLYAWAGVAIANEYPVAVVILGFVSPFVHELSIFLWASLLPALVRAARTESSLAKSRLYWLGAAAPLASMLLLQIAHSAPAVAKLLGDAPLSPDIAEGMQTVQLGQTTLSALGAMVHHWSHHWRYAVPLVAFFALPTIGIIGLYSHARALCRRDTLILLGSALVPLALLGLAWDLSRIVVMSQLTAVTVVMIWESRLRREALKCDDDAPRMSPLIAVLCVLYACCPLVYSYFEYSTTRDMWNVILGDVLK
jgi:hypothetical protein